MTPNQTLDDFIAAFDVVADAMKVAAPARERINDAGLAMKAAEIALQLVAMEDSRRRLEDMGRKQSLAA